MISLFFHCLLNFHLNSVGPGKGIATYFSSDYKFSEDKTNEQFQITKISSEQLDILNIYRSQGADTHQFLSALVSLLNLYKDTLLVGDFNLPLLSSFSHPVIVQISKLGFNQFVSSATHDKGFDHFKTYQFIILNILLIFRRNSRLGLSEIK